MSAGALLVCVLLVVPDASPSDDSKTLKAQVIAVIDGDTVDIFFDGKKKRVRLEGIDAPERGQPYGTQAKQALSKLVFGKAVTVESTGTDRYGRMLARLRVGPLDVCRQLVENGMAWHYKRYSDDPDLAKAENAARKAKQGLWTDPNPLPPWDWRKRRRK